MEHLTQYDLARLVDEAPTPEEGAHLESCSECRSDLDSLEAQTAALGALPEIMPPKGDWRDLEAQLRSEGLVHDPGLFKRLGLAQTPNWMKGAAAVMIFFAGTGAGAAFAPAGTPLAPEMADNVEDAATAVLMAESDYRAAMSRYQELLAVEGSGVFVSDPVDRVEALQQLLDASRAAVRRLPGDPYVNGMFAAAQAEHEAAVRMASSRGGWF